MPRNLRALGRVPADESRITLVHPKIEGWIEKLWINKTGDRVKRGDILFSIYSPKLVAGQQEYLLARHNLQHKLLEESLVVSLVCIVFLLHTRSALVAILTLPIGILIAFIVMQAQGINANIMSLGGMVTVTLLCLLVLPVIYGLVLQFKERFYSAETVVEAEELLKNAET